MSAAVAAILEGMPEPKDLRLHHVAGRCVITAGSTVLFDYDAGDTAMRNMALAALRQLGFTGRAVARLLGALRELRIESNGSHEAFAPKVVRVTKKDPDDTHLKLA